MRNMKAALKFIFYRICCPVALFLQTDRLLRLFSKNKCLIIMYHGISKKDHASFNGRHLTEKQFEKQLLYFIKNFRILPLSEICERKQKGETCSSNTIALTFDDGFLNNYLIALPLLEKHRVPATFFICGASLGENTCKHPSDLLDIIHYGSKTNPLQLNGESFLRKEGRFICEHTGQNAEQYLSTLNLTSWTNAVTDLQIAVGTEELLQRTDPEVYQTMGGKEIREAGKSKYVSIGSHSHQHINLTRLTNEQLQDQLNLSKRELENCTGKAITSFAFPDGHFNEEVIAACRESGYAYLVAGGEVPQALKKEVFPRMGLVSRASWSYTVLSINKGFARFGF